MNVTLAGDVFGLKVDFLALGYLARQRTKDVESVTVCHNLFDSAFLYNAFKYAAQTHCELVNTCCHSHHVQPRREERGE